MDLMDVCRKAYQDTIRDSDYPSEFKRFLRTHERVPKFVDNLAKDFRNHAGMKFTRDQIEYAVREATKLFVFAAHRQAEERVMSPLAKAVLKKREDDKETFRKEAEALDRKGADHVFETRKGQIDKSVVIDPL